MLGLVRTTAVLIGAGGAMAGAAYGMLTQQGRRARRILAIPGWFPFRADGVYLPDGSGPVAPAAHTENVLRFAVLGDSSAAGLGVDRPEDLPGVVLARGLAEESGRPVRLDTLAICGSTSRRFGDQVDATLVDPPHAALIMIGANDVTLRMPPRQSAKLLGEGVARLSAAGTAVVVGTCPDLGSIRAIPQPLRAIARTWSRALSRLQHVAVLQAGGMPVPLADLLATEFSTRPALFSRDHFHPSTAGYDAACSVLLPALCSILGVWAGGPLLPAPVRAPGPHFDTGTGTAPASASASASASETAPTGHTTRRNWAGRAVTAFDRGVRRARRQALDALPRRLGALHQPPTP